MSKIANYICFDLQGPLSPRDSARDLMQLNDGGGRIFEVISRYDGMVRQEERTDYEPGPTLLAGRVRRSCTYSTGAPAISAASAITPR